MKKQILMVLLMAGILAVLSGCFEQQSLTTIATDELVLRYKNSWGDTRRELLDEISRRATIDEQEICKNATTLDDFRDYSIRMKLLPKYRSAAMMIDIDNATVRSLCKQWYINNHRELSTEIQESILDSKSSYSHNLKRGMKEGEVTAAIGFPDDVNRSTGSWGVHEQWVYGSNYFYFENGILTAWQD